MSAVVIEDQSPIMHRAKIRLGIAIALLAIALVSLILAGENKTPRPVAPRKKSPPPVLATISMPPVAVSGDARAPEKNTLPDETPALPPYEALPDLQSFTAAPEASPVILPPAVAEAPAEPLPTPRKAAANRIEVSAAGDFILQVGVFADAKNAEKQREKLSARGIESRLESKLRIGPFGDTSDLEAARERLQSFDINVTFTEESTSRGLMLRTGLFHDLAGMRQLQSSVEEHGYSTRTETRVLVGPFDNKNTADAARSKVKSMNISAVLMRAN